MRIVAAEQWRRADWGVSLVLYYSDGSVRRYRPSGKGEIGAFQVCTLLEARVGKLIFSWSE